MTKEKLSEVAEGLGWTNLGPQKNGWMISFLYEDTGTRCNVYYTTMTFQFQKKNGTFRVFREVESIEEFERLLLEHYA